MSGRLGRLRRLVAIRGLAEDLDRGAVQAALKAVDEVENALLTLEGALAEARLCMRAALAEGARSEWMMADVQAGVAVREGRKLRRLLGARKLAADVAMARFLESRREHEQVKQLVVNAEDAQRVDDLRRSQAEADEWFLSKRAAGIMRRS